MTSKPDSGVFRQATPADIPEISRVRLAVRENTLSDPSKITHAMMEDHMGRIGRTWVCELDGRIVGFSAAASHDSSIWALFIEPGYEGRGIGQRLLAFATDWLFALGNEEVWLSTSIDTRADRFYARAGWRRGQMKDGVEVYYRLHRPGQM
jgi:GNAT superfamily N-acetyltransferase